MEELLQIAAFGVTGLVGMNVAGNNGGVRGEITVGRAYCNTVGLDSRPPNDLMNHFIISV